MRTQRAAAGLAWLAASLLVLLVLALAQAVSAEPLSVPLHSQIERFVRARAAGPDSAVEIPPLHDFQLQGVDPSSIEVELSTRAKRNSSGAVPVTVVLSDAGREVRRGVVTARVSTQHSLWVAARPLGRGARIQAGDLRRERRDSRSVPQGATQDEALLVGKQLKRSVGEGRPLRVDWVEAPSLVERGQLVRLVLQSASLRIEGAGRAVSDGALGERIRIVNLDSKREVTGCVAAEGVVHVGF